jgi:hypothetical protein
VSTPLRSLAALSLAVVCLASAACASLTPAPSFSKDSPADAKAPSAPAAVVPALVDAPAKPAAGPAKPAGDPPAPLAKEQAAAYVCPMHPQVKSDRPGSCSVCGMSLVKAKAKGSQP